MAAESEFCMLQYTMLIYGRSHHHHHQILLEHGTLNAIEIHFSMLAHITIIMMMMMMMQW